MTSASYRTVFDSLSRTSQSNPYSRKPDETVLQFDRRVIDALERRYATEVDQAAALLAGIQFNFRSMSDAHDAQMRRSLLARHAFPYLVVREAFFPADPTEISVLAAALAGHTLSLTQLDYHLDGVDPEAGVPQSAVKLAPETAVAYAVRMVFASGRLAGERAEALFRDALEPMSGFVVERMHEDWQTRGVVPADMKEVRRAIDNYVSRPDSRMMASGYWELMTRAAFVASDATQPDDVTAYVRYLRRLRQLADEMRDVEEDLRAGVITLPVLLAMEEDHDHTQRLLRRLLRSQGTECDLVPELLQAIRTPCVAARLVDIAHQIACDPPDATERDSSHVPSLSVLVDIKLGVLEATLGEWMCYSNSTTVDRSAYHSNPR